jgi:hypothetical protein
MEGERSIFPPRNDDHGYRGESASSRRSNRPTSEPSSGNGTAAPNWHGRSEQDETGREGDVVPDGKPAEDREPGEERPEYRDPHAGRSAADVRDRQRETDQSHCEINGEHLEPPAFNDVRFTRSAFVA